MSRFALTVCCLALSTALLGCSGPKYKGEKRFPVSGDVTFEGQAVDVGSISLIPEGKGNASGGVITDGKYDVPEEMGPTAGTYRVEIRWLKRTGRKLKDPESGEMYDERREALPDKLHTNSELTIEVPLPENRHDFKLSK